MRRTLAVVAGWLLASPAGLWASEPSMTARAPERLTGSWGFGLRVEYQSNPTLVWNCLLAEVSGDCHGCTGKCSGHYQKLSRQDIAARCNESIDKTMASGGIKRGEHTGVEVTAEATGKVSYGDDRSAEGSASTSSESHSKEESSSNTSGDVEVGTKNHAPLCWTWNIHRRAEAVISLPLTRTRTRWNLGINFSESVGDEVAGNPVVGIVVWGQIDETKCCCASKAGAGGTDAGAGAQGPGDKPPGPGGAQPTPRGSDEQVRAREFLGAMNGALVAALPPAAREETLSGIRASAASRGIDLESLGDWKADFLAGAFGAPASPSAQYLGRSGAEERFVVPERFAPGQRPSVTVDGRPVPDQDVLTATAKGGEPFTLVSIRREPSPRPAVITVLAPSGTSYTGEKPADSVEVASSTTIRRGPSTTVITVVPTVETRSPDGRTGSFDAARNPAGGTPAYTAKDGSGFWNTLFQGLNLAASVLVPLGTTLLLKPEEGGNSAVRTEGDGSLRVEVPNAQYDSALAQAQKSNTGFTSQSVASSVQAGLAAATAGQGRGITVTSALVPGGATSSLRTGDTVVLSVSVDPAVAPSFRPGTVQVALADAGRPVGYMPVHDVFLDPQTRRGAVSASLPPGLTSSSGALLATVVCGSASSNPVELRLDPGEVEVVAIQKTALSGTAVQVKLVNRNGGRILGTLSLAGPGNFPGGGTTAKFDAWGTAFALVQTTDPGAITLTFTPDPAGGAAGMGKMFG
jgi:hypothetical protein